VEVVGHGVARRLDQREQPTDDDAARQRVADGERDGEMDGGEREGLGHGRVSWNGARQLAVPPAGASDRADDRDSHL